MKNPKKIRLIARKHCIVSLLLLFPTPSFCIVTESASSIKPTAQSRTDGKLSWKTGKKKTLKTQYENCQDVDISSVKSHKKIKIVKTVAEFCFTYFFTKNYGLEEVKEAADAMQSKAFREKLQKRVIGQIESRLYRSEMLGACVRNDRNRLSRTKVNWPLIKEVCKQETKKLKSQVKNLWPKMRIKGHPLKDLTTEDQHQLKKTTWDTQKKAKASYEEQNVTMEAIARMESKRMSPQTISQKCERLSKNAM